MAESSDSSGIKAACRYSKKGGARRRRGVDLGLADVAQPGPGPLLAALAGAAVGALERGAHDDVGAAQHLPDRFDAGHGWRLNATRRGWAKVSG